MAPLPIKFQELVQLGTVGVDAQSIGFNSCTLESDHFICIREKKNEAASPEVVILELKNGNNVTRRPIKADSAIMHWTKQIIALKAQSRTLQIFDLEQKKKLKSCTMNEDVQFWKWVSESTIGLVTTSSVYHWDIYDAAQEAPVKMFERNANLNVCPPSPCLHPSTPANPHAGLPNHQLPSQRGRQVDGRRWYLLTAGPRRRCYAAVLQRPGHQPGH
jgi:clathrin heavy chain